MPNFYQYLDLPKLPDEIINIAMSRAQEFASLPEEQRQARRVNPPHTPGQPTVKFVKDGILRSGRSGPRMDFNDVLKEWVIKNVSSEYSQVNLSVNLPPADGSVGDITPAHTDCTRSYVLIYLIDITNTDQQTVFYREQGQPIHRKRNTVVNDYTKLIELDRVVFPLFEWVMLDATVLHDIENIQGHRIAVQIGFDIDPFGVMTWSPQ